MTERLPNRPQYDSPRDEVLHTMCRDGWANASCGQVDSPSGLFSRMTNSPAELPEIQAAFDEFDYDYIDLNGSFVVVEDAAGVKVTEYKDVDTLFADYEQRERQYEAWRLEQES